MGDWSRRGLGDWRWRGLGDQNGRGLGDQSARRLGYWSGKGLGDWSVKGLGDWSGMGLGDRSVRGLGDQSGRGLGDQRRRGLNCRTVELVHILDMLFHVIPPPSKQHIMHYGILIIWTSGMTVGTMVYLGGTTSQDDLDVHPPREYCKQP